MNDTSIRIPENTGNSGFCFKLDENGIFKFVNIIGPENKKVSFYARGQEIIIRKDENKIIILDDEKVTCLTQNSKLHYQFLYADLDKIKNESVLEKIALN